jgi:hypothetical protein
MLSIVTWKWDAGVHPKKGIKYGAHHVNVLAAMLKRHLHTDYEMVCITDDPKGIDDSVRIVPLWHGFSKYKGCFGRLRIFAPEMREIIGPRFVSMDLDVVVLDDITPLFDREEDFIIWGEHFRKAPYCGSFLMMDAGCRSKVWDRFDPGKYPPNINGRWPYGTDQDHICRCLYPEEAMWTAADGVYNFNYVIRRWEKISTVVNSRYKNGRYIKRFYELGGKKEQLMRPRMEGKGNPPKDARLVFFNGIHDPSSKKTQKEYPWILEHWRI